MRANQPPESGRLVAALLIVAVLVVVSLDATTSPELHISSFLGVAPLIAALRCTFRPTLAVAVVYVVSLTCIDLLTVQEWAPASRVVGIFGAFLVAVFSLVLCRTRLEREALHARTSLVADTVQRAMLRELPLRAGPVEAFGFYVSAQEGARVGGDIYEAVETPHGLRVMIGDVQGKGMPAIEAGLEVLASFREAAYYQDSLESVAERMEQALIRYNTRSVEQGTDERFVTALLLEVRGPRDGRVMSCGHIPYYLVRDGRVYERSDGEGELPLGLGALSAEPRRSVRVRPTADDWVVLCTDGVTEARGADGEFYPLRDRLAGWTHLEPAELARTLRADLERFTGGDLKDDATALIIRRAPVTESIEPTESAGLTQTTKTSKTAETTEVTEATEVTGAANSTNSSDSAEPAEVRSAPSTRSPATARSPHSPAGRRAGRPTAR
ncbi:PP2C family protein-serine/threonine phosphatase [Streptomyces halobius]|uniref:SpoIIE family protein phosphatase n=1 Tax=Streptomyces halobius TaxID=2879846 RepID=A0ABY4M684_9ACTN|nr:PP2C family protein-serine/threonine phosphatase [Streptomyces halobius]UQA93274.1 SpoIIE family protein phosphatase [Streptomyces halobius]